MKTVVIIPAHNEENYIRSCLDAYLSQTVKPDLLLVVDDNSSDQTALIVAEYGRENQWIQLVRYDSAAVHQPGAKVVRAFNYGLSQLNEKFEFIGKFDADIILPENYFEIVLKEFEKNPKIGLCSGLLYIKKGTDWIYEAIANKSHVRGPIKLYRISCFDAIGGLRSGIGWDTADVLLAQYYGFEIKTIPQLKVKHLRPTGASYSRTSAVIQGKAYYGLRYGVVISLLASLKMSWYKRSIALIWQSLQGYFQASRQRSQTLVTEAEGRFIRKYRWKKIWNSLF